VATPGVRQGSSGSGWVAVAARVLCECDSCVFDEYVQYMCMYACMLFVWLLATYCRGRWYGCCWLLAGPLPACLGLL